MRVTSSQPFIYILVVSGLKEKYGLCNTEITEEPGSWRGNIRSERSEDGMHGGGSSVCKTLGRMGLGSFRDYLERKSRPLGRSKESWASIEAGKVSNGGSCDFILRVMGSHGRVSKWVEGEYIKK